MTVVVEQAAGRSPPTTPPRPETSTSPPPPTAAQQQPTQQQPGWSNDGAMPRLSEVVSGWHDDGLEYNRNAPGVAKDGDGGRLERGDEIIIGSKESDGIPPHRRKILRTRAAPAGPHPYLDRFASGMHRPLEGDDASWRKASIQPVPIPDLGHTGIRTKFSTGAGNGFTPNGAMTEIFRTGIHDTIRNLPLPGLGDAHDMKARDYVRAVRKHRVDPCGGSLLHAHMSSLEFSAAARSGPSTPAFFAGGAGGSASLRQSGSLGRFRSKFSPPSSPLSARRALAGYGRGISRSAGSVRDFSATPADDRQALLLRELSSVKLAAAAVAGGTGAAVDGSTSGGDANFGSCDGNTPSARVAATGSIPMAGEWLTAGSGDESGDRGVGCKKGSTQRCVGVSAAECRAQGRATTSGCAEAEWRHGGSEHSGRLGFTPSEEGGGGQNRRGSGSVCGNGAATESRGFMESARRASPRARGRRRGRPADAGLTAAATLEGHHPDGDGRAGPMLPDPNSSSSNSHRRATPTGAAATTRRIKKTISRRHQPSSSCLSSSSKSRSKPHHLKKPFSSDSLLSCLLDVRFGNTRDLSPEKPPGQKWDLRGLPVGMTVGISASADAGWDGFDETDDLDGGRGNGREVVAGLKEGVRFSALGRGGGQGHDDDDGDFSVVRGGVHRIGGSNSTSGEAEPSDRCVPTR